MDMEKLLQEAMKLQQDLSVAQETIDKKEYEASMGGRCAACLRQRKHGKSVASRSAMS